MVAATTAVDGMCSAILDDRFSVGPTAVSGFGRVASMTMASSWNLSQYAAHSGIAFSMAAVTAGAADAPAPAPIDSLSCSLHAISGRSAVYAKPTYRR